MDTIIKTVKRLELNTKILSAVLNYKTVEDNLIEHTRLCCHKKYQERLMKIQKRDLSIYKIFLTMTSISLFYCCEKVRTNRKTKMIGKKSMKYHYQKK